MAQSDLLNERAYTNFFLCPNDQTEWLDEWSCTCNDRCPRCHAEIEPYASRDNETGGMIIHNEQIYAARIK
jgi:transcription initiation factor IIE alpha subunit